jgi:hypothetical protein
MSSEPWPRPQLPTLLLVAAVAAACAGAPPQEDAGAPPRPDDELRRLLEQKVELLTIEARSADDLYRVGRKSDVEVLQAGIAVVDARIESCVLLSGDRGTLAACTPSGSPSTSATSPSCRRWAARAWRPRPKWGAPGVRAVAAKIDALVAKAGRR